MALPGTFDPETRLRILVVRGILETNQDAGQARATWEEVENLAKALHHYRLATRAMGEQGIAAFLLGDTSTAKKQVIAAWELSKIERDPAASIRYASAFGAGLVAIGRYSEAMTPLDEAIKIANAHPEVAYPSIAINTKIDAFAGLHRYSDAMSLANDALRRLQGTLYNGRKTQLYVSRGFINASRGAVIDAIADYATALGLAQQMRNFRGITDAAGMLAQTYLDAGRLREALDAVNTAIGANTHIPDELYLVPRNLLLKAQILEKMGRENEAEEYYSKGITLVDALIRRAPTVNVQRQLFSEMSDIYSGYFASLCLHRRYDEALQVVERGRGRLEAEAIKHHESQPVHAPTPEELRLAQLNIALINSDDPKWRSSLMDEIYRAELEISPSKLIDDAVSHPVNVRQLQQTLSPAQLVIEYVLAQPNSYALAITKEGVRSYRLRDKTALEADAVKYRDEICSRAADPALARILFTELLLPIQEYAAKRDLIIVPDGQLHLLPFSALMEQQSYVLTTHSIDIEPSATCFVLLQARSKQKGTIQLPYLGVAAWTQTIKSPNPILRLIGGPERSQFIPLPASKAEVEAIADDLPSPNVILLGSDATETRFKALVVRSTEVIHLALHGYADLEYPDRSALVFAAEHAGPDDGLLQAREIRSLHLNAKLVTLSACDTGVGPVGEVDVANIVNAFIEAGADSVVSTFWELEDQTTEHLMVDFYSRLALHERKIDALREAQLDLLNSGLPPYFWAGVQIVGDPSGTI
ncbi:MAG TPA: CHAT domain-containing tetratricopeptide repeat protein [Terracidiphilus sp.]|nr:CHAT domain-containing tetratricopeptide repeat protein [Terracidiphilus sp.]